jgi:3',5'-cyclic AMP phosphodiesterase CpdA
MKKISITLLCLLCSTLFAFSQVGKLQFHNHQFKIIQFTDLHWAWDKYKLQNDSTFELMRTMIRTEHPDLVILTGDVIVTKNAIENWKKVTSLFVEEKVPFAVAFGNHDEETDVRNPQILKFLKTVPYNLTRDDSPNTKLSGSGNCTLPVYSSDGKTQKWMLYLFDSHNRYNDSISYYDWIHEDQVEWYRMKSTRCTRSCKRIIPSLAFFHIPLPEYKSLATSLKMIGTKGEAVCSPDLNSGLFTAFIEQGDVIGVFAGHDHNNDYLINFHNRLALAYGRKTGYVPAYKEILPRGARIIKLYEDERKFDTYIRDMQGTHHSYTFEARPDVKSNIKP